MNKFLLILITVGVFACSKSETDTPPQPASLQEEIDLLIEQDQYEQALARLSEKDASEEVAKLKEKTHLNYGIHLIYQSVPENMRENANNALRQFIEVLKINPDNEKAISEIDQIMSIYATFPDRSPREDILEELRRLGFDY